MECIEFMVCSYKVRIYLLKGGFDMHERFCFFQGKLSHSVHKNNTYHIVNQVFCKGSESVRNVYKGYITDLLTFSDHN